MPRKARIFAPGIMLHIMARGIEGRDIFIDDEDRQTFCSILAKELSFAGYRCYAWVLMPNHYHFLLRTSEKPVSTIMRTLNSTYARYYSKKYNRRGYLFQDRFKSIATQDQSYVEEIIRYIHLNPYRAGICKTIARLACYPWSGHAALLGNAQGGIMDTNPVLRRFSPDRKRAREKYLDFVKEGIRQNNADDLIDTIRKSNQGMTDVRQTGCWVIGDQEFVTSVLNTDKENRLRIALFKKHGWTFEKVARKVADCFSLNVEDLARRSRLTTTADARKAFAYLCRARLGFAVNEIGRYIGMTGPAASVCIRKGEAIVNKSKCLNLFLNLRP
jgi:putative transposase